MALYGLHKGGVEGFWCGCFLILLRVYLNLFVWGLDVTQCG